MAIIGKHKKEDYFSHFKGQTPPVQFRSIRGMDAIVGTGQKSGSKATPLKGEFPTNIPLTILTAESTDKLLATPPKTEGIYLYNINGKKYCLAVTSDGRARFLDNVPKHTIKDGKAVVEGFENIVIGARGERTDPEFFDIQKGDIPTFSSEDGSFHTFSARSDKNGSIKFKFNHGGKTFTYSVDTPREEPAFSRWKVYTIEFYHKGDPVLENVIVGENKGYRINSSGNVRRIYIQESGKPMALDLGTPTPKGATPARSGVRRKQVIKPTRIWDDIKEPMFYDLDGSEKMPTFESKKGYYSFSALPHFDRTITFGLKQDGQTLIYEIKKTERKPLWGDRVYTVEYYHDGGPKVKKVKIGEAKGYTSQGKRSSEEPFDVKDMGYIEPKLVRIDYGPRKKGEIIQLYNNPGYEQSFTIEANKDGVIRYGVADRGYELPWHGIKKGHRYKVYCTVGQGGKPGKATLVSLTSERKIARVHRGDSTVPRTSRVGRQRPGEVVVKVPKRIRVKPKRYK